MSYVEQHVGVFTQHINVTHWHYLGKTNAVFLHCFAEIRAHHQRKNTEVAGTCTENEGLQNTQQGNTVGIGGGYKRKPRRLRKNWIDIIR